MNDVINVILYKLP